MLLEAGCEPTKSNTGKAVWFADGSNALKLWSIGLEIGDGCGGLQVHRYLIVLYVPLLFAGLVR